MARTNSTREVMSEKELAKAGSEVAIPATRFSDEQLSQIESFDDALGLLADEGIVIDHADEVLGNGFAILKDKGLLVGVECLFMAWQFNTGDNGEFVSANVIARMPGQKAPAKFVVNDGSSGIREQLRNYSQKRGKTAGLHAKKGLTRSDYTYDDPQTGEKKNATTFYIDLSA